MSTTAQPPDAEPDEDLSLDVVFDILSSERRRHTLAYLLTESEQTTLGDLAEHIACLENDKELPDLSSQERKRVYVGLYQSHLPRMDDAGVVDFDSDRKTVELGANVEQVTPYLELASNERADASGDRNWVPYYLGTSVVGGLLLVLQTLVFPIAWLSTIILDGLLLAYFSLSLAHARDYGLPWIGAAGR